MFSKFFIDRPIFATVLALLIVVAGLVTLGILPIAQYPDITPPTVQVSAVYPGANAQTVAQTVGIPIEQQVNGVDGMLYMSSNSSSSGAYSLTITFAVGTDIDMATVQVQNRVSVAQSSLPTPVVVQGVTVQKQSSNIVMFLTMTSRQDRLMPMYSAQWQESTSAPSSLRYRIRHLVPNAQLEKPIPTQKANASLLPAVLSRRLN